MEIHIGANSNISKHISREARKVIKISSKNKKNLIKVNYNNLSFFKNILKKNEIDFVIFFLGKNLKKKSKKKSFYINYQLPLKILKYLISLSDSKIRVIFFGTFLENEKNSSKENLDYKKNKIALRQKIINLNKKRNFEFVWLKLPIIYGYKNIGSSFINNLIKKIKTGKKIKIDYKYNTVNLLHVNDLNKVLKKIKLNWKVYRNQVVYSDSEGPFFIFEFLDKIKQKLKFKNIISFQNKKKRKKLNIKNKIIKINLKNNSLNFIKKYV